MNAGIPCALPVRWRRIAVVAARFGTPALALVVASGMAADIAGHCGLAMPDAVCLRGALADWGAMAPLALILLMAAAIVFSPIPSGPIAVAAGMIYGTLPDAGLVIAGAILGALAAFGLGRMIGEGVARVGVFRGLDWLARPRSQTRLMALVFASRLVPFISFDAVSYLAGMTCLATWRFALATLAGVLPICLALTWGGEQLLARHGLPAALLLCGTTALPLAALALRRFRRRRRAVASGEIELPSRLPPS